MALLEWTEEFSVGSQKMNDQHKKLFAIINAVDEGGKMGKK